MQLENLGAREWSGEKDLLSVSLGTLQGSQPPIPIRIES
jgi:hypothetical protein